MCNVLLLGVRFSRCGIILGEINVKDVWIGGKFYIYFKGTFFRSTDNQKSKILLALH